MKTFRHGLVCALVSLMAAGAFAQPGPAGSAPGMGMGRGMGPGARWGTDATPGWGMMNRQERQEHRQRMMSMKTQDECKALQTQHHEQMAARAKERGITLPAQPRRDPCAGLPR